jgi:alkaline phosphatase
MKTNLLRAVVAAGAATLSIWAGPATAAGITVRVTPPDAAQFLQFQNFDLRVEATGGTGDTVSGLKVTLDGVDVTSKGRLLPGASSNVLAWMYYDAALGIPGPRVFAATATGASASGATSGSATSTLTIRTWDLSQARPAAPALDAAPEFELRRTAAAVEAAPSSPDRLHLGDSSPAFHVLAAPSAGSSLPKAKNVILFIGDGMGIAHRTAARVLSKGYAAGKAKGTLAMDRLPFNGMLMTSSLNSLITDSAPSAHSYSTGNKTNNGMEGVFPDNDTDPGNNPRVEHLSEFISRTFGKVTGIVSDAFATDATLAAFLAHTADRNNGTLIASQYFDSRQDTGLKVLMGGGSYDFIPKRQTGSKRTDERDVIGAFKGDGWTYVDTATALAAYAPGSNARLLGLFNLDNMNVAYDKLKLGDPTVVGAFTDQPFLRDMAKKAIDVLKQYPNGFFLMVEGAHIDKQAHRMDGERSIYDVIQLDQAIQVALDFAQATNSDADPNNDTLVIVTADHECGGLALPAVARPEKPGTRDYAKTYQYSAPGNDSKVFNFTDYTDAAGTGYPSNPAAPHKLIMNFGANSDRYEDWQPNPKPKDPGVLQSGVAVANPSDPAKTNGVLIPGVIENGANGGDAQTQAVHTMSDIPVSAYGPGASQFSRVLDNTEVFFSIVNAMLGTYPVPVQF